MRLHGSYRDGRSAGFTLIELLVVVAIIALLISILLPSLSKARAQARSTLCASRISQLAKAMLIYCDDFDETPPFLGRGWEDCDDVTRLNSEIWPVGSNKTLMNWAMEEDWLMPDPPVWWMSLEEDWDPTAPVKTAIRYGTLFSYTRFERLYLCPEFERVADSAKSQNVFNYTRSFLGRKWFHRGEPEGNMPSKWVPTPESENWSGQAGPILKISQIYAPGQMYMMFDERWDKHCAAPLDELNQAGEGFLDGKIQEGWMAIDPVFSAVGNEVGQYHGAKRHHNLVPPEIQEATPAVKSGNIAFYDGHVGIDTDPLPDRKIELGTVGLGLVFYEYLTGPIFAQRGLAPNLDMFDLDGLLE